MGPQPSGTRGPLRAPGGVLLVSCYDLGRRPVAVATALEGLVRAGFSPAVRDLAVEALDEAQLAQARLVLISAPMHTALRLGVRVAERARKASPGAHVGLFGLYAALNREHLLFRHCDSVVGGESAEPLVALAEAIDRELAGQPKRDLSTARDPDPASLPEAAVEGASTRAFPAAQPLRKTGRRSRSGAPAVGPAPGAGSASLPLLDKYARLELGGELRLVATVEASRGCLHLCRHCPVVPVYQGRFVAVPREQVLEGLAAQMAAGARHVTFGDPDFLNGPTHALKLARELHQRWPALTFDATIKVEHLLAHRALLPELAAAGCLFITTAVESLNDGVLAALAKGHTPADVPVALRLARAAGLDLRPTLLPFTPWSALEDLPALFDFAEEHDLIDQIDPVQYTLRLLLPPGSAVLTGAPGQATVSTVSTSPWLGAFDAARFTWRWTHPDPRADALQTAMAALAEAHATAGRPPRETFAALRALAEEAAGRPARAPDAFVPRPGRTVPRLSEPWFC